MKKLWKKVKPILECLLAIVGYIPQDILESGAIIPDHIGEYEGYQS